MIVVEGLEEQIVAVRAGDHVMEELADKLRLLVELTYATFHHEFTGEPDDLKAEGLAAAYEKLDRWKHGQGSAFAFFQRVAQNRMRDVSRANRRKKKTFAAFMHSVQNDPCVRRQVMPC